MTKSLEDLMADDLGFCCCGAPVDMLQYIATGLAFLDFKHSEEGRRASDAAIKEEQAQRQRGEKPTAWSVFYKAQNAKEVEHFGSDMAQAFFYYWADKEQLTEHGGGVFSSWLTPKGENLLADIRAWQSEDTE